MGWCSGTEIFDAVASALLDQEKTPDKRAILSGLIDDLENMDWDCQSDSDYYDHPLVQELFREKHPDWFEDE